MDRDQGQFEFASTEEPRLRTDTSSTFANNMSLPVHRWFRFSAGFSAEWVQETIREIGMEGARVLDPFAGSGTTLLAAEEAGCEAIGVEAHPFIRRVAAAKLLRRTDPARYLDKVKAIQSKAAKFRSSEVEGYPDLIKKCYSDPSLEALDRLRRAVEAEQDDTDQWRLSWMTLVSILRPCSSVGTAQWQYILPRKAKKKTVEPGDAFSAMARTVAADMAFSRGLELGPKAKVIAGDARTCDGVEDGFANLVITSPPYPNNYDYADATRLEMCFFREIEGWGDLQSTVREHLVRSCSQHVPERAINLEQVLAEPELGPIRDELTKVCEEMGRIRLTKGGKKTYHLMVACYFLDLAKVWMALRRACAAGSRVCFVIGDSAPYGVYVPVVDWFGRLSEAAGFSSPSFEKTRDRNIKWKNRKHRVPLCEGRLWLDG